MKIIEKTQILILQLINVGMGAGVRRKEDLQRYPGHRHGLVAQSPPEAEAFCTFRHYH